MWSRDIINRKSSSAGVSFIFLSPSPPQVTSNDKTPAVISSALEKHNQDPKQATRYELIQLLPEGKGKRCVHQRETLIRSAPQTAAGSPHLFTLLCCSDGDKREIPLHFTFFSLPAAYCGSTEAYVFVHFEKILTLYIIYLCNLDF